MYFRNKITYANFIWAVLLVIWLKRIYLPYNIMHIREDMFVDWCLGG